MKNKIFLGAIIVSILSLMLYKVNVDNMKDNKLIIYGNNNTQKISNGLDDSVSKTENTIGTLKIKKGNKSLNNEIKRQLGEVSAATQVNVISLDANQQLAKIENTKNPIAVSNTMKLFVGIAFEKLEANKTNSYIIKSTDIKEQNSILKAGTGYSYTYLRQLMLKQNNNDAANILLKLIGKKNVNEVAKSIGAKSTLIDSEFGKKSVGKTTASDLTMVLNKLYQGKINGEERDNILLQDLASFPAKGIATQTNEISYRISDSNSGVALVQNTNKIYIMSVVSSQNIDQAALGNKINQWVNNN